MGLGEGRGGKGGEGWNASMVFPCSTAVPYISLADTVSFGHICFSPSVECLTHSLTHKHAHTHSSEANSRPSDSGLADTLGGLIGRCVEFRTRSSVTELCKQVPAGRR